MASVDHRQPLNGHDQMLKPAGHEDFLVVVPTTRRKGMASMEVT